MPLLKAEQSGPSMKDAVVLDLGDVGRQAERIRQAAEAHAARVLADAELQAKRIIDGAQAKGYDAGHARGLAEGREAGQQQGRAEALERAGEQLQQLQRAWLDAAQQWDGQRRAMDREARQEVIAFALKVAQKLVHRVVEVDPSLVVDQVGGALAHVLGPHDVTVRVHPEDRPLVEEAMPQLAESVAHLEHVHLAEDPKIGRGGCEVVYGQGRVDATIEKQVQRVADLILPAGSEAQAGGDGVIVPTPTQGEAPESETADERG